MANPNPAPFMTGSTTVVRDPSPSDLRNVSQPGESVPDPNFEFQYVLTGYPDTQIEVDVLRDGKSLGQFTLNSKTPSVMVTPSGPKLSADFTKLELSYTVYYYTEG